MTSFVFFAICAILGMLLLLSTRKVKRSRKKSRTALSLGGAAVLLFGLFGLFTALI